MRTVSIIIRSIGRPELADALAAVAAQTYPSIEAVVVDATGGRHPPVAASCGAFPLVFVAGASPRTRSVAANAGLDAAGGDYLAFLDDDDLILPTHVAGLVRALDGNPSFAVAYSYARIEGDEGRVLGRRAQDYSRLLLFQGCYVPIHGAMFRRDLLTRCRVDESLGHCEDWDFWLQASAVTDFLVVPEDTAIYRSTLGRSGMDAPPDDPRAAPFLRDRARVVAKWREERERLEREIEDEFAGAARLFESGAHSSAFASAEAILRRYPFHVGALTLAGTVHALRGDFTRAAQQFRKAVDESPDDPSTHFNLAQALDRLGRKDEARFHYDRAAAVARAPT